MSVLIPNCVMQVGRAVTTRGAFGDDVTGDVEFIGAGMPAARRERGDGTWGINLDPDLWPVRVDDRVRDIVTSDVWVITSSMLAEHPDEPDISHIRCEALQVTAAGVEPGGATFVGRP